jgi:DNA polymerase-3 subunit delta'
MTGFSNIIGHNEIIRALNKALQEAKIGHAYLFAGPAGVGKKTLTKAFAKRLLCNNLSEKGPGDPSDKGPEDLGIVDCNDCRSCTLFQTGAHPDFITVAPSGNSIKIEQLRELQHNTYLRPLNSDYKVFFFPDAEQLTEAAANSFLKILEEPPAGVVFLFTAVRADRILPTIRSRCQVYNLFPVPTSEIRIWLQGQGFSPEEAEKRSVSCEGLPGKALILGQSSPEMERIELKKLLDQDLLKQLKFAGDLEKKDRQDILALLTDWESQMRRDLLAVVDQDPAMRLKLEVQVHITEKLGQVKRMIESNVNPRLAVEELLIDAMVRIRG